MPPSRLPILLLIGLFAACGGGATAGAGAGGGSTTPATDANVSASPSAALSTLPSSCTAATAVNASTVDVHNFAYVPACIKVAKGAQVTFTNQDSTSHTVTAKSGSVEAFDSGDLASKATFSQTFSTSGGIGIYCSYHSNMLMGVIVD